MDNLRVENVKLKETAAALKRQVELRATALNLSKVMVRVIDLQGRILYANSACTTLLGYSQEELLGSVNFDFMHAEDREFIREYFYSNLLDPGKDGSVPVEYRIRHKNGNYLWVRAIGRPLKVDDGREFVVVTIWDITESRQIEDQLRALAERLHEIREEERMLFSREIHDEFGQALTALKFELAILAKNISIDNVSALAKAKAMMKSVDETIHLVRRISTELRPPVLDDVGLNAAMEWLAQHFQKKSGITTVFSSDISGELQIEKEKAISIFRILQEALNNVARHSEATRVKINLYCQDGKLVMQVEDNGMGMPRDDVHDKHNMGIMEMRERAFALDGIFNIGPAPRRGTKVEFCMPLT